MKLQIIWILYSLLNREGNGYLGRPCSDCGQGWESLMQKLFESICYRPCDLRVTIPEAELERARLSGLGVTPFAYVFTGRIVSPLGEVTMIPGFYTGGNEGRVRCRPDRPGRWEFSIYAGDDETTGMSLGSGSFQVRAEEATNSLAVEVDPDNPTRFRYSGTRNPWFASGYECDWLWALEAADPGSGRVRAFLSTLTSHRYTFILMNLFALDTTWSFGHTCPEDYGPPAELLWEGTAEEPDYARLSLSFFEVVDAVMEDIRAAGLQLHRYMRVYNKMVRWPAPGSPGDDLLFDYVIARYSAYDMIHWDFAKETYYELDKAYIAHRLRQFHTSDPYRHLVTVHDDPAGIEHYGDLVDYLTVQQHYDFHVHALHEIQRWGRPYINAEFGYEWGPLGADDLTYQVGQSPEELIRRAYAIVMAGGYPAYYYAYTAWDVIKTDHQPLGYRYFEILVETMTRYPLHEFTVADELCLWRSGFCLRRGEDEYLFYIEGHMLTPPGLGFDRYTGTWIDIFTGEEIPVTSDMAVPCVDQTALTIYKVPYSEPLRAGLLHLRKREQRH